MAHDPFMTASPALCHWSMCQDNLGVEGVVIYDDDADTKKVRIGARSSVAKVKESETEDKSAQQALFEKSAVDIRANTKDWVLPLAGAWMVLVVLRSSDLVKNQDQQLIASSFFSKKFLGSVYPGLSQIHHLLISFGQMSASLTPQRDLDRMSWNEWHTLAKRAIMNRVMDKMELHHDTYAPINEVMRLHFRFASLGELIEPLSNLMAVEHPFIPEFQLLCNRASDQLFYVFCKHHGGGGDFRQVFRQYFVERDPHFFNKDHWDYMNVSLKGSCSAEAFTDLLLNKVESPVATGEISFCLRLIEEHLNCDLTSVRWYVLFPMLSCSRIHFVTGHVGWHHQSESVMLCFICCLQPANTSFTLYSEYPHSLHDDWGIGVDFQLPGAFLDFQAKVRDSRVVIQEAADTENERWRFQKRRRRMYSMAW